MDDRKGASTPLSIEEQALEKELNAANAENQSKLHSLGELINKPFTLWLFSTIAVGIASFIYTNYAACNSERERDREKLTTVVSEVNYRQVTISLFFLRTLNNKYSIDQAKGLVNPDTNYLAPSYKGVKSQYLRDVLDQLSYNWELEQEVVPGSGLSQGDKIPIKILTKLASSLTALEKLVPRLESGDTQRKDLIMTQVEEVSHGMTMAPDYWKVWLQPNVCVRRALWPTSHEP